MRNVIKQVLKQIQEDKRKRRRMGSALLALSLLVITGVVWQLRITGITMTSEALCGQLEHQHGEQCVEKTLVCQQEVHTHTELCYEQAHVLQCQDETHTHEDGCYTWEEKLTCQSGVHTHTEECYESHDTCGFQQEHTHTVLCYSDTNADRETQQDWESTIPDLTGKTSADLMAVAMSQVGYAESQQNYHVADDGTTVMGYTRYGAWFGNEYGNWNAMFVSFCLNYAQHPAYETLSSGSPETMRQNAQTLERLRDPSYTPAAGDLVFLDRNADGAADVVAVVTGTDAAQIYAVEGDQDNTVQSVTYTADSVLSYAQLSDPENMEVLTEDDTITVRFVIADEGYTNDNETTHITVSPADGATPMEAGFSEALTYTAWAGRYKVTGTGELMKYTISAGTTLAASGYSLPGIDVENIGSCANSYLRSITWLTDSGMICNAETVFEQNTTLTLYLNSSQASYYSLVFACNCTGASNSAGKHVVLTPSVSPSIAAGQSLAENLLPTAEQANAFVPGTGCNVGTANGKVFTGWYVKNRLTGEETRLTAGVPLIDAYCDGELTSGGNNLYVYTHWRNENAVLVTATFQNGEQILSTREVEQGTALGTLPAGPEYTGEDGLVFLGWQVQGAEGFATAETVISEDTVLNAVFGPGEDDEAYEVFLYDIAPDGTENTQEGVESISLLIPSGETVAEWMTDVLDDETPMSQCVWYTRSGGTRTLYDLNTPVTGELHLYTYSYQIQLTRGEQSADEVSTLALDSRVAVKQDGNTLTLTLREGEHPSYSDFVVNGVDYSLYTWTANGQPISISDIVTNGVTENITATAAADGTGLEMHIMNIDFYILVDNSEYETPAQPARKVASGDFQVPLVYISGNSDPKKYYLSAAQLENVYGEYGFQASQLTETTRYFPHTDRGSTTVWANNPNKEILPDQWFSPLLNENNSSCDVYYLPGYTGTYSDAISNIKNQYSFYTTTIRDNVGIYTEGETVPETEDFPLVFRGRTATITLKTPPEHYEWSWSNRPLKGVDNGDGTTTYTIDDIINKIVISSKKAGVIVSAQDNEHLLYGEGETLPSVSGTAGDPLSLTVKHDSAYAWLLNGTELQGTVSDNEESVTFTFENVTQDMVITPVQRHSNFRVTYNLGTLPWINLIQSTRPTLDGGDSCTDTVTLDANTNYVLRTPSVIRYTRSGTNALVTVVFRGWDADSDGTADLPAGRNMTAAELSAYGENVTLTGIWEDLGYHGSVSFYLDLELEVLDYNGSTSSTSNTNFTDVLYGTQVEMDPVPTQEEYSNAIVLQADAAAHTAEIDAKIRSLVNGVTGSFLGQERTFTLASFPEDELMLEQIRAKQQGYIEAYETWKAGLAEGADSSVSAYRAIDGNPKIIWDGENYIPVENITSKEYTIRWYVFKYEKTWENGWHIDGVLVKKQGQLTVTKSFDGDAAAIQEVKGGYQIAVTLDGEQRYSLNLQPYSETNPGGYVDYNAASDSYVWKITLTTDKVYNLEEEHYISALNGITTVADYKITNGKNDVPRQTYPAGTGINVTAEAYSVDINYMNYQTVRLFNTYLSENAVMLRKVDDSDRVIPNVGFQLYDQSEETLMTLYQAADGSYYLDNADGRTETTTLTTNRLGQIVLADMKSHSGTYTLKETVPPTGYAEISGITFQVADGAITLDTNPAAQLQADGITLKITNTSATLDVTAHKIWTDGTNLPVKVKLCLNGAPMSDPRYEVTLDQENNWTYTWQDLPRYVGGEVAQYTIRETWIGNTAFDASIPDGYNQYLVTYVDPTYHYNDQREAVAVSLTVRNRLATGNVEFTKVDNHGIALTGAQFQLFEDESCTRAYGSPVVSGENGKVTFNALTTGTYYMKETQSPSGYATNDTVYVVTVDRSGGYTIREKDGTANILSIANTPASAALRVRKVDEKTNTLTGASFKLFKQNGENWEQYVQDSQNIFAVDDNGMIVFNELADGRYYLQEHEAPAGYYRLTEKIDFTIADGVVSAAQGRGTTYWHFDPATQTASACIIVTNVPGQELPKTGGMGTSYGTLAGLLMMAASLYVIMLRRKRERGQV